MKLLIIGPTPPPQHGVSISIAELLKQRDRLGFTVRHLELSGRRGIEFVENVDLAGIVLFLKQLTSLFRILLRDRPRISYLALSQKTVGFVRDSTFIVLCRLFGSKVVIHLHGGNFDRWYRERSPLLKFYVRRVMALVARAIVLDAKFDKLFDGLVARERVCIVPNGIAIPNETKRGNRGDGAELATMLYLGNLNRWKGTFFLLEVVRTVATQRDDVKFVFAGPWSNQKDKVAAETLIQTSGIEPFVQFLGSVTGEEKWDLLTSATVFVFPGQQQEGQPLSVLEAMACGLPVLFTDRGCLRETVIDEQCGLQVDADDPKDLAAKILWMLDHREDVGRMGAAARKRAEETYSLDGFIAAMARVFQELSQER